MFSKKYKIPIVCDSFLNIYDKCNIGCPFCKFNQNVKEIHLNKTDFSNYHNQKVLVSYSTDPYPIGNDTSIVPRVIKQLHENNCSIVFLTRKATSLKKDISYFKKKDYIGVSISEDCKENSPIEEIQSLFDIAIENGINTWISLEPTHSLEFILKIITQFKDTVDFIRIGKNDLDYNEVNWKDITKKIQALNFKNVFIKE